MPITVREAAPADAPALCRMNVAFNGDDLPGEASIRAALSRSTQEVTCLAECDGSAVGFLCAQVLLSWCYDAPCVEITELYVEEGYRRRGAARQLIQLAERLAAERFGADSAVLLTGGKNLSAQTFYEAQGYKKDDEVHYSKRF